MNTIKLSYAYLRAYLHSITFRRVFTIIALRISFTLSWIAKKHICMPHPAFISIEPTNTCNLHCPECPTGNKTSTVPKGIMNNTTYNKIISETHKHCWFINLYFQGEPFLNPNIYSFISQAHTHRIISSTSTNAHYITSENAEKIVDSGLTKIIVSLDGYNQETYEKYRKGGSFEKAVNGIKALSHAKDKAHSLYPIIEVQCLLFKHTEQHMSEIKSIGYKNGADIVLFKTAQFYNKENISLLPRQKSHSRYIYNSEKETLELRKKPRNRCWRMWSSVVFTWNGTVLPCCFDKNHSHAYGNIHTHTISDILCSEKAQSFKKQVHTKRTVFDICRNCTS
ncbi:MAG: radical SAM/SPASM domain-containing protein [Bacteroidales bacterium]